MTGETPMGYTPTPRPTFDVPTTIRFDDAVTATWGDDVAGHVLDRIFVSSSKIHHIIYELEPHAGFTHSEEYRTIFAAHEVMYVLSGVLALANPETGEVVRALPGEAVAFGPDTWHHGFNESAELLRVLEFFAPPPSTGTSGAYARTKPMLERSRYSRDESDSRTTLRVVRESDYQWRIEGGASHSLLGVIASSAELTVGKLLLPAGRETDVRRHGGDMSLLVIEGTVTASVTDADVELRVNDCLYVPEGFDYRLWNESGSPAAVICGVAPRYLP
jgi:mannose-6-phosphate isomerase-like protein (cupin superfamily)